MKVDKIRQIETAEMKKQLGDQGEQMFRLAFGMTLGQSDGLKKYRELKKDRAKMLTVLRERDLSAQK